MLKPTPLFPGRGCRRRSADILRRRDFEDLRKVPDEYTPDELRDAHNDLVRRLLPRLAVLSLAALAQACLFADGLTVVTSRLGGLSSKSNVVTSVMWDGDDPVGPSGAREIVDSSFAGGTQAVNRVTGAFDGVSTRVRGLESRTNEWNKVGDKADVSRVELVEGRTNVWNSALHEETDPTVPAWAKQANPPEGMPATGLVWSASAGAIKTANGAKTIGAADVGALPLTGGSLSGKVDGQGWWLDGGRLYVGQGVYLGGDNRPVSIVAYGDAYLLNDADGHKWFYGNPDEQANEIAVMGDISALSSSVSGLASSKLDKTNAYTKAETDAKLDGKANKNGDYTEPFIASELTASGATLSEGNLYLGNGTIYPVYGPQAGGPPMIANTGSGFILYHSADIPGNPTWHYGQTPAADNEIAVKGDLDNYLPLTGGELSGGVYAQQSIASATTVGAQTIDAWADIRLGSETYYLHNEDECLADYNGKFAHESMISATDPTFSNAVLAVQIDTNTVAQIGELKQFFDDLPTGTVGTSIGGIILALLSAVAWLKKNKVQTLKLEDGSVVKTAENGVAKLDDFFTESNSLLTGTIAANSARLALDEEGEIIVTMNTED